MRTIRGADEIKFVPSLGVVVGLILAIGGIVVLIYFIHHIATSLQVTNIAVIVGKIADRKLPTTTRIKDGKIRVFVKSPNFREYMETAFDQIRINGKANLAIFTRLLKALSIVGERTSSESRKEIVGEHLVLTKEFADESLQTEHEKKQFEKLYSKELKKLSIKEFNDYERNRHRRLFN